MIDLREHIGEFVLGFVLLLKLFGKKTEAEKLSANLKNGKTGKKHGKQLENDLAHIDKLKKED